ncbi:unnamed protein product [Mytilus edulis]|uniref:SGNH hydrolase-type esterase domain-containing protein n=1 Tax=Mytilus edulis TaxID=6550 RepID=A0A8S3SNP7_MYTED|nr:unnamed protein product [Mytilus edulis]
MECVWPPPPSHIVLFIAYLSLKGRAHKTVSCYVTAIGFRCKVLQSQFMDYSQNFIIRKMLEGLKRSKFSKDKRLPITSELLTRIIEKLPLVCYSAYESLLFAAAFSVAFHGFLRVGELVYTKLGQAQNIISIHGTQILWGAKGEFIRLHLTHSKGDQTGKGISIDIRKTDSTVCPILLLKRYLRRKKCTIWWQGKGGMNWQELVPRIKYLLRFEQEPDFLIIHCGGNNIGSCKLHNFRRQIKSSLCKVSELLPKAKLIWSQILPRLVWRNGQNIKSLNRAAVRINNFAGWLCLKSGGGYIKYPEITWNEKGLFNMDGVHLSNMGNELFLYRIQSFLQEVV